MSGTESLTESLPLDEMRTFAEGLSDDLGPMFGRDVVRLVDAHKKLEKAVRRYFSAKYDSSWGPSKDWHKRHDEGKREDELLALLGATQEDFQRD